MSEYIYQFLRGMSLVMEFLLPYMKYIVALIFIAGFLWVNKIVITNQELRPLFIQSFQDESGRISGKSISAFVCVASVLFAWFVAILYSKDHIAPEYFFWGVLGLITSLYGIKEVGKVMGAKFSSPFASNTTNNADTITVTQTANNNSISYEDPILKEWKDSGSELLYSDWYKQNKTTQDPVI